MSDVRRTNMPGATDLFAVAISPLAASQLLFSERTSTDQFTNHQQQLQSPPLCLLLPLHTLS
jgi:hypothetical protein